MEIWKPVTIELYKDIYEVSNYGNVNNIKRDRMMKPFLSTDKLYLSVKLCNHRKTKSFRVHRLVAMAFIGMPENDTLVINHKDGNGKNNYVDNLEWVTQGENLRHKYQVLGWPPVRGAAKLTDEQVLEIRRLRHEEKRNYKYIMEKHDLPKSTLSYIINRKTYAHV